CYAPQYGAAKDPVNLAGMIAANFLDGDMPLAAWESLGKDDAVVLDVREPAEFEAGALPGAVNLPLSSLRKRLGDVPRDKVVKVYCGVGQRGYYAVRFLRQNGIDARNLSGGYATWKMREDAGLAA
ncbi:MAG: rhodanese-like domain-containing protein, partial [Candidatus Binatia bacterium]